MQSSLHMIDMPKGNEHVRFVGGKQEMRVGDGAEEEWEEEVEEMKKELEEEYVQKNKQQYKKYATALVKQEQLQKVKETLELEKNLK